MGNDNLKEHGKKTRFRTGESGNPKGRPKGSKNRSTLFRYWLDQQKEITNPITGEAETLDFENEIILATIERARNGDLKAVEIVLDALYGKATQRTEVTGKDGTDFNKQPFEIVIQSTGVEPITSEAQMEKWIKEFEAKEERRTG